MSFKNAGKARRSVKKLSEDALALQASLGILKSQLAGIPRELGEIRIEMANMFPGRGTPQEQMNALLGLPTGTPAGSGMSAGPATALEGRAGQAWGETLSPEDALLARQLSGEIAANMQEANAFADQLEATARRFEAGFPNSYFTAVVLKMEIPYLRIGARSAAEARRYIMAFQPAFLPGFQASLQNPNMPPGLRALTQEAIQILLSGQVSGGAGAVGGGALTISRPPRAAAPEQIPPFSTAEEARVNAAGISGGAGATGAGLGGSAASTDQQVRGIAAAVSRVEEETRTARNERQEANRRLADQWNGLNGWTRRADEHFRGLRTAADNAVAANRRLAEDFQGFQRGQQRIEGGIRTLSGHAISAVDLRNELERLVVSGRLGVA